MRLIREMVHLVNLYSSPSTYHRRKSVWADGRSDEVIVGPLSTVGYTSVACVSHSRRGPTDLIYELQHRCVASLDVSTDDRDSCSLVVHTDACRYIGVYFTLVSVSVIVDRDGCR